jgi:hypothetical protein
MIDFDELRSPKAILGIRQINGEQGGATVHCVVLADGFIIECGSDGFSARRARLLADAVNDGWSEQFDFLKVRP